MNSWCDVDPAMSARWMLPSRRVDQSIQVSRIRVVTSGLMTRLALRTNRESGPLRDRNDRGDQPQDGDRAGRHHFGHASPEGTGRARK